MMPNKRVGILAPELVKAKASQILMKTRYGDIRYKNIGLRVDRFGKPQDYRSWKDRNLPLILLEGPTAAEHVEAGDYLDRLQLKWAQFENIPFFSLGRRKDFDGLTFEKRTEDADQNDNQPLVRHEIWRRSYRSHPYLRPYSAEDFLQHAVQVITSMAPHFLVGGKKLPMAKVAELMERWTHVLEDAEYRRLDIKKIQRRLPDLDSLLG